MNIKKLLAEVGDSGQRDRFYQDLIAMLAVESEISYPDKVCPGPEYDAAIRRLTAIIKAKGKIHAFYNLNCRWGVVPGARVEGQSTLNAATCKLTFKATTSLNLAPMKITMPLGSFVSWPKVGLPEVLHTLMQTSPEIDPEQYRRRLEHELSTPLVFLPASGISKIGRHLGDLLLRPLPQTTALDQKGKSRGGGGARRAP